MPSWHSIIYLPGTPLKTYKEGRFDLNIILIVVFNIFPLALAFFLR